MAREIQSARCPLAGWRAPFVRRGERCFAVTAWVPLPAAGAHHQAARARWWAATLAGATLPGTPRGTGTRPSSGLRAAVSAPARPQPAPYSYRSTSLRLASSTYTRPTDAARHARMVELVTRMLELHQRLAAARTEADRELYSRQVAATDKEIDALVYGLYGLTQEEIKIVEGEA